MISHRTQGSLLITAAMVGLIMLIVVSACDTAQSPPATPTVVITSTAAPVAATATLTDPVVALSPTENATESLQEFKAGYPPGWFMDPTIAAAATQLVIWNNQHLTAIALTPTLGPAPYTPEPTRTLGVGIIAETDCLTPANGGLPVFPNCWEANVGGTWLFVGAGSVGYAHDPDGQNPLRGLIVVCPEPIDEHMGRDSVTYETPVNVGEVRIASISGSLVTIVPRDPNNHASFVFDLATRRWVTPASGPVPSPSIFVSPIPNLLATWQAIETSVADTPSPYPSTPTANGKIYNRSLEDMPEGKMLGEVNYWAGEIGGLSTLVYAGHARGTPNQGIILVETPITGTVTADGPTRRINDYPTLDQAGAVRITSEVGGRLTLQAADGSLLRFDLNTRQWLSLIPTTGNPDGELPTMLALLALALSLLVLGWLVRRKSVSDR